MSASFLLPDQLTVFACSEIKKETLLTLWNRFSLSFSTPTLLPTEEYCFCTDMAKVPALPEDKEYAILVDRDGFGVAGKDFGGLMRGIFALLMKIELKETGAFIKERVESSNYCIRNRMLHICIFPENDFYFIKKLIRLAGLCQYTHLVFEFWGTLQFDCMKELGWPDAFSKEQAKELIEECRNFGMEPIPMFNQLGHASGCRMKSGKHVVLDQNPHLQHLFTPDGWAWDIFSEKVLALFKEIRKELYELFGEGEYIHLGCDEAYYYTKDEALRRSLPEFLRKLTDDVVSEGHRPMVWMDMMLERGKYDQDGKATATCPAQEVESMQQALNPATVMVDWQYKIKEAPIKTLLSLKENERDAMGAPWYDHGNYTAYVKTISAHQFFGIMMTTWHTLFEHMPSVLGCAKSCGASTFAWSDSAPLLSETATLLRRLSFEKNSYQECGWATNQIKLSAKSV